MSLVIYILLSAIISSILTGSFLKRNSKDKPSCQFNESCTKYNRQDTMESARRVISLIFKQEEETLLYKTELRKLISEESKKTTLL